MKILPFILIIILIFSLLINYLYLISKKSTIQIINDMGIGYNLGNSFDCYKEEEEKIIDINDLITSKGNPIPSKKLFLSLKKYGFKTIRFPITWQNFIDENYKVNQNWMKRVKTIVDLIINEKLYCIINVYNDGINDHWLSQGIKSRDKYISLWTQIANEFKDYDEYLIFESFNELFLYSDDYYGTIYNLTQTFIDIIRNSGGKNTERLLIIIGPSNEIDLSISSEYKIPIDPYNNIAVNINYYIPFDFTLSIDHEFHYVDENGVEYTVSSLKKWGSDADYNELIINFEKMKSIFVDKGIGVIIGEVGVLTEEKKEIESIREYLYSIFSFASDYEGIMACLWDTSAKSEGNMNYYNRETNEWYDKKIGENFKKISKGKYVKPSEYIIMTNTITYDKLKNEEYLYFPIGTKKLTTIIFNVISKIYYTDYFFEIRSYSKVDEYFSFEIGDKYRKKEYDGSYTYTVDVSKRDLNEFIEIGNYMFYTYNYITLVFQDKLTSIDKKAYKQTILNYINEN